MSAGSNNLEVFKFEKNRALVSNQAGQDADPQTFVTYVDVYNDKAGRRRKRPGRTIKGANAGAEITAIHEFVRTDETTGALTYYQFRTFTTKIQKSTDGGATWADCVLPFVPTSAAWTFKNFNNRCFATNGADHFIYFDGSAGPVDARAWYYVGCDAPAAAIGYQSISLTEYAVGNVTVIEGSPTITGQVPAIWSNAPGGDSGKYIDIGGVRYQISTVAVNGNGTTIAPVATLTGGFKGTGATYSYKIYRGLMDWAEAPIYAIAYKNTRTGHISNIGPKLQIVEKDQVGRTITLTGIPHSQFAFRNGYDLIQIFRTPKNGTTLVEITHGTVANVDDNLTTTFTETSTPSTYLDVDLNDLEAPLVLNRRPVDTDGTTNPLPLIAVGEWNGRLFGICAKRSRVFFSAAIEDTRVGRVEECWPEQYEIQCNEPKGLVEVGIGDDNDQLLIHTSFGDRAVIGFDPTSFLLRRVATRRVEGFQGGSAIVNGSLVELHRDKRLIDYGAAFSALQPRRFTGQDLGADIQDKLNACNAAAFTKSRLAWFSYQSRNFLLISVPSAGGSTSNDRTFIYDYDLDNVYDDSRGFSCFATVHNTTSGELEIWGGTPAGDVFRLLNDATFTDNGSNYVPSLKTAVLRPFDLGGRGEIQWIQIFTTETGLFVGKVYLDEEPNLTDPDVKGASFVFSAVASQYQTAKSKKWQWKPTRSMNFNALQLEIAFPSTGADITIEKILIAVKAIVPNSKTEAVP